VTLQAGCRLVVAPFFYLPVDWSQRILIGSGTKGHWRTPNEHELDLLVSSSEQTLTPEGLQNCLCLFQLPQHLIASWWRLVEQMPHTAQAYRDGFDAFVAAIARFLEFKEMPVPCGTTFTLLFSNPGQRSIRGKGNSSVLSFNLVGDSDKERLWGAINLGDEPTSLVYLNRAPPDLLTELGPCSGGIADQFFMLHPEYPLIRLQVAPGEGYRLPFGGLLVDVCTLDKQQPDMLLLAQSSRSE
jgi:hypothetical protein